MTTHSPTQSPAESQITKKDLKLIRRNSGVALIMFDSASKFNALGTSTINELNQTLDEIEADPSIKAVIAISGKAESFIIGADLHEIRRASSREEILKLVSTGQKVLNRMAGFAKPFVIAINGICLGGGLEIALAAHHRVASLDEKTQFGLPETRLGLIPGLGGTQRLPRKIGLKAALDLILSASTISAKKAKELNIIEELVDAGELIEAAERAALKLVDSPEWRQVLEQSRELMQEESASIKAGAFCLRDMSQEKAEKLLSISERAVKLRTKGNYPAQIEAINAIKIGLTKGFAQGLSAECESFTTLAGSEVAANLITLFFNSDFAKAASLSLVEKHPECKIKTLGIIGAGNMGTALAAMAASCGMNVLLKSSPEKIQSAEKFASIKEHMHELVQRALHLRAGKEEPDAGAASAEDILARITYTESFSNLKEANMIVECVLEDHEAKNKILQEISEIVPESCVIASNTSALSIAELSKAVKKPQNFLGVHFFHPIDRMPLVELISHAGTEKAAVARASDLVLRLDKTPLLVKDKPGFLINRLLCVYLFELARMAEEQVPINWIEESMIEFGMPMGPLELMDEIGIDVAFSVAKNLEEGLGERLKSPEIFKRVCAIGLQGKRRNCGFYLWEGSERKLGINPEMLEKTGAVTSAQKCPEEEKAAIKERMILAMLDEAARCLEEKIVSRPREIDFALIMGTGFPAFRGGLLRYADQIGLANAVKKLESIYELSEKKGTAYKREVSQVLKKYASEGRGFYSLAGGKEA